MTDWLDRLKNITDKGHETREPVETPNVAEIRRPSPKFFAQDRSIVAFSAKLNRRITVSWTGDNPQEVLVDGQAFSLNEIVDLKRADPTGRDLEALMAIKATFDIRPD